MRTFRLVLLAALAAGSGGCESKSAASVPAPASASAAPSASARIFGLAPPLEEALPAPADVAAPPVDAEKTPDGLVTKVLEPGTGGQHPVPGDVEFVHYVGWRKDGVMFDRSGKKALGINLKQVVPGWAEGLQLMVVGERRRMWIPAKLAFGDTPRPAGRADVFGDVVLDVTLVSLDKPPPAKAK